MTLLNAGAPPLSACKIDPSAVEAAVTPTSLVPLPYTTPLSVNDVTPVPPFGTATVVPFQTPVVIVPRVVIED